MNRAEITKLILEKNPHIDVRTLYLFDSKIENEENKETFAIFCNNSNNSAKISEKQIGKLMALSNGKTEQELFNIACEEFSQNPEILDKLTSCLLSGNTSTMKDIINFVNKEKSPAKESYSVLGKNGTVVAHKIEKDLTLSLDPVFTATFKVEEIKNNLSRSRAKRCYILESETVENERGKGINGKVLSYFLPKLCEHDKIPAMVLQADAFSTNSEKGGQEKLEKYYEKHGFYRACAGDKYTTEEDFEEGKPFFAKQTFFNLYK